MGEKNTSTLLIFICLLCSGRMAQWYEASIFALEEVWGAGSNPGGATTRFLIFVLFFLQIVYYPSVCFSLVTLFSSARVLRISSLREHGGGFSLVVILNWAFLHQLSLSALYQISSLSVFISNGPRSLELASLLYGLPFLTLCLSLVVALSPCFTGQELGLVVCSRPTKHCAFAIGRVSWFG